MTNDSSDDNPAQTEKKPPIKTPAISKVYFLFAAFLIALPTLGEHYYKGATGRMIVATESLDDTLFERSVIYIIHHNLFSATGVIINKQVAPATIEIPEDKSLEQFRYGGPVGFPDEVIATRFDDTINGFHILNPDEQAGEPTHYFVGFSGWTVLQLEMELIRGKWNVEDAPLAADMLEDPDLWYKLTKTGAPKVF